MDRRGVIFAVFFIFTIIQARGIARADEILIDGKPCNDLCQQWMQASPAQSLEEPAGDVLPEQPVSSVKPYALPAPGVPPRPGRFEIRGAERLAGATRHAGLRPADRPRLVSRLERPEDPSDRADGALPRGGRHLRPSAAHRPARPGAAIAAAEEPASQDRAMAAIQARGLVVRPGATGGTVTVADGPDGQHALTLDQGQVVALIAALGEARAHGGAAPPTDWPMRQTVTAIIDPRWSTEADTRTGATLIHLRDPRYGWLHYSIPRQTASHLGKLILAQGTAGRLRVSTRQP